MKWLIDLIIEAIGIPPTFIDRGDPASEDFTLAHLAMNNVWHDLDLSAIVPAGAQAVHMRVQTINALIGSTLAFRKNGNVNTYNLAFHQTYTAAVTNVWDWLIAVDADRKIEYKGTPAGWFFVNLTVRGWWL